MSEIIITYDYRINTLTGQVFKDNKLVNIRSKTFALLQLLLESAGDVVSKDVILQTVWSDVLTDDQVIFQSIKELRKVFSPHDVIKTHPRKGYQWIAPIRKQSVQYTEDNSIKISLTKKIALLLFIMFISIIFYRAFDQASVNDQNVRGSLIVLPINHQLKSNDANWVRFGAMDQLIQLLPSSDDYSVLKIDDVLEIMKRARVSLTDFKPSDISGIFDVSGAAIIITADLSGEVKDYQLIYTIYQRNSQSKGIVVADDIRSIVIKMAEILANKIDIRMDTDKSLMPSNFNNEMLASAFEYINSNQFAVAEKLLSALHALEPDDLLVNRLLAKMMMTQKNFNQAKTILIKAIKQAELEKNGVELARIRLLLALAQFNSNELDKANINLNKAHDNALSAQDWLYLGYIETARAKMFHQQKKYLLAKESYQDAIKYHQLISCPYGTAQGYLHLSQLAYDIGQLVDANDYLTKAQNHIQQRQLTGLQLQAQKISASISQKK